MTNNNNHKLYLGMFSFQLKKRGTSNSETISMNEFLSESYPNVENKFKDGFAKEIIDLFDAKAFKNKRNTHGGTLDNKSIASENRYFDILIDGGITGIEQFLVNNNGDKQKISRDKIVGLKFYARFWLPAGGKTGYVFIQKYSSLSLKPLFDELIKATIKKHDFAIASPGNNIRATTTKERVKNFLKHSTIRDITVISKNSSHSTGAGDAQTVSVKLRNIKINTKSNKIGKEVVKDAMKNHGFIIGDRHYEMTATYETRYEGKKEEEKTTKLDASEDNINIIPNIKLPNKCIDSNGYPQFDEMKLFVNDEIEQIKIEAKM